MRPPLLAPLLASFLVLALGRAPRRRPRRPVGRGSYTTALPHWGEGAARDDLPHRNVAGKTPTNDWWSSLAWMKYLGAPISASAGRPGGAGRAARLLPRRRRSRPTATPFSAPCRGNGDDLILGHSAQDEFPDARVDGFSDWFVTARFAAGERSHDRLLRPRLAVRLRPSTRAATRA